MSAPPVHPFDEMVQLPEAELRLASAALLFARDAYPHVEVPGYLRRLNALADRVDRLAGSDPWSRIEAIQRVVCQEAEYQGNSQDYYDPRNSYLNEVIDRRRGIPISLSAIWLDIARSLDYPLAGVNFPGHFLVRYESGDECIYVDPFAGGGILGTEDLRSRLCSQVKKLSHLPPEYLAAAGTKAILMRMLNNLLGIYVQRNDWHSAEPVLARQVALCPEDSDLWCRRGQVYLHLHKCECAVACFQRSLELTGCHPNAVTVKRHLQAARRRLAEIN